jgi:hypothetical protein
MDSLSLNFLKTLKSENELLNFDHYLFKNGVRGNIKTFKPNFDLALTNSALSGLQPSSFTALSDLKYKFSGLEVIKFQLFPRYLFFRNSAITQTLTFFHDYQAPIIDNLEQYYLNNNKKTLNLLQSFSTPIYFKKSLNERSFPLYFVDLLDKKNKKSEIVKKSFFLDEYIKDKILSKIDQVDYSIIKFPGLKNINKYFLHYIYPIYDSIPETERKQYREILKKYYDYYNSIIGNLIASIQENELLVIISFYEYSLLPEWREILMDFLGKKDIHVYKDLNSPGTIFFYEKTAIKKDYPLQTISIFDIFPTLLYYAELEIPAELKGNVIKEMFTDEFILRNPIHIEIRD